MLTWGLWYWPTFLIVASIVILVGFLPAEIIALITQVASHTDNTLSYYARYELGISAHITKHTVAYYLSLISWVSVTTILTWHIWFSLG